MNNVGEITKCEKCIRKYIKERLQREYDEDLLNKVCRKIWGILEDWTGSTYVGKKKDLREERAYQKFFQSLHDFLEFLSQNGSNLHQREKTLAEFMMFRGTVFRYLGFGYSLDAIGKKHIDPINRDIYVSWSKSEKNQYIENKLYGPKTWIKAKIKEPEFGIDIQGFELWRKTWFQEDCVITRGNEKEVVFPTFKKNIVEIVYL